eukprot:CAMPEP_0113633294 /NCGR_PEP_ID=MMETSP0017_2-20120614/17326_1 /TAXON_ID=2856 /ORGANISM="Cylindrotheca closterium" /LENGTH=362 /DNA_ID=CAMNT_0000543925 /DNA_START=30 /DNA_END=1118 /DNA_ORIENTATION=- /assembly_acc=CAM_ASM_000147
MIPRKRTKRMRAYQGKPKHQMSQMEMEQRHREQKDMLADNLYALIHQESSGRYNCVDYLAFTSWHRSVYDLLKKDRFPASQRGDSRIDEYCREQIVEWSFRVVDYFRIDREVVAVSLSMLDRFLATCKCDRSTFKLAATTTLQLAVKLLHPCRLGDLGILSDLSRGEFDMADVREMENHILKSLGWSLHPPTAISFSTLLLDYVFADRVVNMTCADIDDLHDISSFFTELALCDYFFVTMRPSAVALACILNALEGMYGERNRFSAHILAVARSLNLYTNQDLTAACHRLWELYERSEECALHNGFASPMEDEKNAGTAGSYVNNKATSHDVTMEIASTSPVSVVSKPCPITTDDIMPDVQA